MRKIIDYIRSCFCKHDWDLLERCEMYDSEKAKMKRGLKWTYRCKKCGYFKVNKNY